MTTKAQLQKAIDGLKEQIVSDSIQQWGRDTQRWEEGQKAAESATLYSISNGDIPLWVLKGAIRRTTIDGTGTQFELFFPARGANTVSTRALNALLGTVTV